MSDSDWPDDCQSDSEIESKSNFQSDLDFQSECEEELGSRSYLEEQSESEAELESVTRSEQDSESNCYLSQIHKAIFEACVKDDLPELVSIKSDQEALDQIDLVFNQPYETISEFTTANICLLLAFTFENQKVAEFIVKTFRPDLETIFSPSQYEMLFSLNYPEKNTNIKLKAAYLWHACCSFSLRTVKYLIA